MLAVIRKSKWVAINLGGGGRKKESQAKAEEREGRCDGVGG